MLERISIIVPVYNASKYLPKCIDSLLNQTYKNIEVILVNDGSTDLSGKICDDYSFKDKRVKLIHKENGGTSDARNAGLKISTGKYIGFVDNDDYIEADMYETLLQTLYDYDADIVECAFYRVEEDNSIRPKHYSGNIKQFNTITALENLIRNKMSSSVVWNKIYKKNLLDEVAFPVNLYYEDLEFNYKVFTRAQKVVYVDIPKYYWLKHSGSITGSFVHIEKMDLFHILIERQNNISKNFPSLFNLTQERTYKYLLKMYKIFKYNDSLDKNRSNRILIKNYIMANLQALSLNPLIPRKHKICLKYIYKINFEFGMCISAILLKNKIKRYSRIKV